MTLQVDVKILIPAISLEVHDGRPYLVATSPDGMLLHQEPIDCYDSHQDVYAMMVRFRSFVLQHTKLEFRKTG